MSGQKYRVLLVCALTSMLLSAPAAQALSRAERSVVKRINRVRAMTLFGRYRHIAFDATDEARNYNADELRVGVRLRR